MNTTAQNSTQSNSALRQVFKLGLDVDLHFVVTAIQCDHGAIRAYGLWSANATDQLNKARTLLREPTLDSESAAPSLSQTTSITWPTASPGLCPH